MTIKSMKYFGFVALINLLVLALLPALIEGWASLLYVAYKVTQSSNGIAEARHTTYDPLLGWVNLPDVFVEDMYGPGISLRTNAQGFRADQDYPVERPADQIRLICSGDSFTLGYGVDNGHAWCQLLSVIDPRFETVNMGQGGYGVDQAFLWYMRDGRRLEHDVHVFAFITNDFERMRSNSFGGYSKPTLRLDEGKIVAQGVPVPGSPFAPFFAHVLNSRTIVVLNGLAQRRRPELQDDVDLQNVVFRAFERLREVNGQGGSVFVLVYLPTAEDYASTRWDPFRRGLAAQAARRGLLFIDLVEAFRRRSLLEVETMFIGENLVNYIAAQGHYTIAGNKFVAETLLSKLLALPEVQAKLARVSVIRPPAHNSAYRAGFFKGQ